MLATLFVGFAAYLLFTTIAVSCVTNALYAAVSALKLSLKYIVT